MRTKLNLMSYPILLHANAFVCISVLLESDQMIRIYGLWSETVPVKLVGDGLPINYSTMLTNNRH
jgi:hypothetical protein